MGSAAHLVLHETRVRLLLNKVGNERKQLMDCRVLSGPALHLDKIPLPHLYERFWHLIPNFPKARTEMKDVEVLAVVHVEDDMPQ